MSRFGIGRPRRPGANESPYTERLSNVRSAKYSLVAAIAATQGTVTLPYQIRMSLPGITSHGWSLLNKWASPRSQNAHPLLRTVHGVPALSRVSAVEFTTTRMPEESDRGSARNPTPPPLRTCPSSLSLLGSHFRVPRSLCKHAR